MPPTPHPPHPERAQARTHLGSSQTEFQKLQTSPAVEYASNSAELCTHMARM
jgi:hypothetical protein